MGSFKVKFTFVVCLAGQLVASFAHAETRKFWVWDLNVMPPGARQATATLRTEGEHSLIYVEDSLWQKNVSADFVKRLSAHLENLAPQGAFLPNMGVVPLLEEIFAPLPEKVTDDPRLIILFADLGQYKDHAFDGFFNAYDQMKELDSWSQYEQHSNEANIIYVNGLRNDETYTEAVIAHETQHLLAYGATGSTDFSQSPWVSEMLAEGAMLLTGYYTDQGHVDRLLKDPASYSLVSNSYVQYGPQILFSSFLIDSLKRAGGLGLITREKEIGKDAIVAAFRATSGGANLSFDAIYSLFVSYILDNVQSGAYLPLSWPHNADPGLKLDTPRSYGEISIPGTVEGTLVPYSFAPFTLSRDFPANTNVTVDVVDGTGTCADGKGSVLWKPLSPKMLAVYSIGCEQASKEDKLRFRLTISEQPALLRNSTIPFFAN